MNVPDCKYYMIDIDGTLTGYQKSVTPDKFLWGYFLFPVIRDLMLEQGWEKTEAENAILELSGKVIFWDYTDFVAEFNLPAAKAFQRMRDWHSRNLIVYADTVSLVKELHAAGKKLFIMSNNPYTGCLFKLQTAGLADNDFFSPYFCRIFGTNILRGCKGVPEVWQRAVAQIPADLSEICVIGDNPHEDGDIPRLCGIPHSVIISRKTSVSCAMVSE